MQNAKTTFSKQSQKVSKAVDRHFEQLIEELDLIVKQLEQAEEALRQSINSLNHAYARRILDWCLDETQSSGKGAAKKAIVRVERDFGHKMTIYVRTDLPLNKPQEQIKFILQEDISIHIL